jgi:hypothetical protein
MVMVTAPTFTQMLTSIEKRGGAEARLLAKYGFAIEELGEDGDIYLAHGHVPPDRFIEAWREWALSVGHLAEQDIDDYGPTPGDVVHRYFLLVDHPGPGVAEGPYYRWVSAETPGAEPCTEFSQ